MVYKFLRKNAPPPVCQFLDPPLSIAVCHAGPRCVFDIRSLTWDEWSYPEGMILPIVTLGTIRPEDSGAVQNAKEFHH